LSFIWTMHFACRSSSAAQSRQRIPGALRKGDCLPLLLNGRTRTTTLMLPPADAMVGGVWWAQVRCGRLPAAVAAHARGAEAESRRRRTKKDQGQARDGWTDED
jgi:hypothetical protein